MSLVDHVADLYALRKYHKHLDNGHIGFTKPDGTWYYGPAAEPEVRGYAARQAETERRQVRDSLARCKITTLNDLHATMHVLTTTTCLPDADYWMPGCLIVELSSMEDVMAATKAKQNTVKAEIRYVPDEKIGEVWAQAQMGLPGGFLPVDDLKLIDMPGFVYARRAPNHPRNLESIYNYYQKIDGAAEERTAQLKVRSMSTGDAIVIEGIAYYVANKGFVTKGDDGTVTPVETPAEG